MKYSYTPEEAQPIANLVTLYLTKHKFKVKVEQAIDSSASYRTTLLGVKGKLSILIEAQRKPEISKSFREFALWLRGSDHCAEMFISTNRQAVFSGNFLKEIEDLRIGLLIIEDDKTMKFDREPCNPTFIVRPDPSLCFGKFKSVINTYLKKFNQPSSCFTDTNPRKDALRDLCEHVEGLTEKLLIQLFRKKIISKNIAEIQGMDWSSQINLLRSTNVYITGKPFAVSDAQKTELHSLRDARNLVDHKVRNKREELQRQRKFADKMLLGVRLTSELISIITKYQR